MPGTKPSCFFCGSKRQCNLILVAKACVEDSWKEDLRQMYRTELAWVCRRCFYLHPSECSRYRNLSEKKEVVALRKME